MSWMNFWIVIQAVIKNFGRSTDKRIEENMNEMFHYYLIYSIVSKYFKEEYRRSKMIWTK